MISKQQFIAGLEAIGDEPAPDNHTCGKGYEFWYFDPSKDEEIIKYVSKHFGKPRVLNNYIEPNYAWAIDEQHTLSDIETIAANMDDDDSEDEFETDMPLYVIWFGGKNKRKPEHKEHEYSVVEIDARWEIESSDPRSFTGW